VKNVSVVIPAFNRRDMLAQAVESVLAQDYIRNSEKKEIFELVVVDDGSNDGTRNMLQQYGTMVRCIAQNRAGVSAARNRGLKETSGRYVAFLDSDDLWAEDKLSIQMNYLSTFPDAAMCYTEEIWQRDGRVVNSGRRHRKHSGWMFERVLPLCLLSLSSALFRRDVFERIGTFDESLPACEDYDFGIRLAHSYPWHLINKPLIIKRGGHPDQLSGAFPAMDVFRIRALLKALDMDLSQGQRRSVRAMIVQKSRVLAQGFTKRNKQADAAYYQDLIQQFQMEEER
jgi:glycosyltransferase involved in cell wall biosynthesis